MATIDEVQDLLRHVVDATLSRKDGSIFKIKFRSIEFDLDEQDVDDYLSIRESVIMEPETAIFTSGYYEQVVNILASIPAGMTRLMRNDEDKTQVANQSDTVELVVSNVSSRFTLAIFDRFDHLPSNTLRRQFLFGFDRVRLRRSEKQPQFKELFGRTLTVKVLANEEYRQRTKAEALKSIAEAGLFNITCARGIALALSISWDRSYYRLGVRPYVEIQFPRRIYNTDIVAYYQLALSSESPILAYLSLYKVLEFFFLTIAEAVLHRRLKEKLSAPNFSHKQSLQLRELASIVRNFDQKTNEQRMLTSVIEHYFMPDEIAMWISNHESDSAHYYTLQQAIFGLSHKVDINPDRLSSLIAHRIYHIRNILVHNKEGELPRFYPFSGQEDTLIKELPLIMYIAEQLIVKSGDDI